MKRQTTRVALTTTDDDSTPNATPFPYHDYADALAAVQDAVRQSVFYALVTGDSGTGKTSLVRDLTARLDRREHQLLYLSTPKVSLLSIARYFAQVLRVTPKRSSLETIKVIADTVQAQPTKLLVWVDEADGIPVDTLGELRTLCEFNHEVPQIFSIVLSGTPELRSVLDAPALFPLKRRIGLRLTLEGLRRDELDAFLVHRFGGTDARRVPLGLRDDLFERTRGIPALLDRIVRASLERTGKGAMSDDTLREAFDVAAL